MNGHHTAKQETVEWREDHDDPVVMADRQQQEHHPEQSDHHGEELQVPNQPHAGYPPTDQPPRQVWQRQHREDERWPVVIHPQAGGEGHEKERWDEKPWRRKDGEQDVEDKFRLSHQGALEDNFPLWWERSGIAF